MSRRSYGTVVLAKSCIKGCRGGCRYCQHHWQAIPSIQQQNSLHLSHTPQSSDSTPGPRNMYAPATFVAILAFATTAFANPINVKLDKRDPNNFRLYRFHHFQSKCSYHAVSD
jgi:hypothetical protein